MNEPPSIRSDHDPNKPGGEPSTSDAPPPSEAPTPSETPPPYEEVPDVPAEPPPEPFPLLPSSIWGSPPYEFPPAPEAGTTDPRYGPPIAPEEDPFREVVEAKEPIAATDDRPVTIFGLLEEIVHSSVAFFSGALFLSGLAQWIVTRTFHHLGRQEMTLASWAGFTAFLGTLGAAYAFKKRSPLVRSLIGLWGVVVFCVSVIGAIDAFWGTGEWKNTPFAQWWATIKDANPPE